MQAQEILATLQERGATVRALDDGQLEIAPCRVLDDDLRDEIRAHKTQVIAELRRVEGPGLTEGPIVATQQDLGAVLIRSHRFGEI